MQPQDDLDPATDTMVGEYANYITVGSTQTEFYIDFFQVVPSSSADDDNEHVMPVRRLLVSPMLVRGLMHALEQEVENYESTYHLTLPSVEE